jgi:glycosyltransferase involved in cell wall biosynthesis
VHVLGPGPVLPARSDLLTVHFHYGGYVRAAREAGERAEGAGRHLLLLERWYYGRGRARLVQADSQGAAAELRARFPALDVVATPLGVDTARFAPDGEGRTATRAAEGAGEDAVIALFAGNDPDRKGLALAIEAVATCSRRHGAPIALWVAGDAPPRFRELARRLGAETRVRFLGYRSDLRDLYRAADMFVFPTLYEGFSLATLEAAASGLPVVAPAANGVRELVGDDEAGLVVERTAQALAAAIGTLADDPELRARQGAAARRRCVERLTWRHWVDSTVELYERLL